MPNIPRHILDLISQGSVHTEQLDNLGNETNDLRAKVESLRDDLSAIRNDIAVIKQQLTDQVKKTEEWDRRWWSIIAVFVAALLSLASGLIVTIMTLVKK